MKQTDSIKKQCIPIIATNIKTGESQEFHGVRECGRQLRIDHSSIFQSLKGKRKQVGGYTFKYANKKRMSESQFSREVTSYLESKGAIVNNQTGGMFSKVGVSDLLVCYKGYFIALELKVGSYQPDPLQISYLQKVRDSGGFGLILRDNIHELMVLLHCIDNCVERQYKQPELPEIKVEEIMYD